MKKLLLVLMAFSLLFSIVGCSDSGSESVADVNEFEVLADYLEGADGGYINNMGSWIKSEGSVNLDDYLVLDLRSAEVFANTPNPINGAVNSTLATMFDDVAGATKPILVTCYSGQTASFAHTLLQLKGIEAYVMKFGMSWHDASLDKWTNNCSNIYAGHADWVKTASPAIPSFDYPTLNTGFETAEEILDARIDAAISMWSTRLITAADVMAAPGDFNIINYWVEDDYLGYGHIDGSFQVTPGTLTRAENLSAFDPSTDANIFYCYTGQTAAASIAYLAVLGYDVKSIKFGVNAMIWDEMTGHKWPKPW